MATFDSATPTELVTAFTIALANSYAKGPNSYLGGTAHPVGKALRPLTQAGWERTDSWAATVCTAPDRLAHTFDPDLPAYLAVNPNWPQAHRIGGIVEITGSNGGVYIAENGQEGVLPPAVRTSWTGPTYDLPSQSAAVRAADQLLAPPGPQ